MKNKALVVFLPILSVLLTSCNQVRKYEEHLEDYVFEMTFKEDFNILQLTDIHWNANTSTVSSKRYLDALFDCVAGHIENEQGPTHHIDLVELTGDMFMLSNAYMVESFVKYFEEKAEQYNFQYTVIWGNHDRHGLYNPNWLGEKFAKAKHCYYIEPNDNLYGRSNFVINLVDSSDVPIWQLANLDSGASFSETSVSPFRDYDYIRKDQTDWWLQEHKLASDKAGRVVPTIAYYHIPQDENLDAYNDIHEKGATYKNKFFKLEAFADNGTEAGKSDFIDVGSENGLKGAFMGHAHNVDWTVEYKGVVLGLGVKTGPELYYAHVDVNSDDKAVKEGFESIKGSVENDDGEIKENFDLIGASLVTIKDQNFFDLEHIYFNEGTTENKYYWVKW